MNQTPYFFIKLNFINDQFLIIKIQFRFNILNSRSDIYFIKFLFHHIYFLIINYPFTALHIIILNFIYQFARFLF